MSPRIMTPIGWCTCAASVLVSGVVLGAGQQGAARPVFTAEQATAGRSAYAEHCASCHSPDLSGSEAPPLAGANFLSTWGSRSTRDLFEYTSATMPQGGATLSADVYASILAHILKSNGAVAGSEALTPSTSVPIDSVTGVTGVTGVPGITGPAGPAAVPSTASRSRGPAEQEALAKGLLKELVEINTTPSGNSTRAAEAVAARLKAAGFPESDVRVLAPAANKGNLVARLRGRDTGRKPIILLAHLDVVEASRQDWTVDPFTFLERDGWFYGRGTTDDKDEAAIWTATLIRLRREGFVPDRDLVLLLTADEEGGPHNGVDWLLTNHRALIDGAFVLNEGGGGVVKQGRRLSHNVQASEKTFQNFEMVVTNSGGHSSLPRKDNAINQLAAGLTRLAAYTFPLRFTQVTRAFFERMAALESPAVGAAMRTLLRDPADAAAGALLSDMPEYNARLRTTCVATQFEGGQAMNALPQRARAIVNCRILPGESPADVLATVRRLVAEGVPGSVTGGVTDEAISIRPTFEAEVVSPSPLVPEVLGPIEEITGQLWPGVPVVPTMGTTGTDGFYFRRAGIPVYGVSGVFDDIEDIRAHGRDERIHETWFFEGLEFSYRLIKRLTGG
jgi:acetylornithine deacetylase/succinyl-diaminopimelate desuccinylase-like protein/cytochrome c553